MILGIGICTRHFHPLLPRGLSSDLSSLYSEGRVGGFTSCEVS